MQAPFWKYLDAATDLWELRVENAGFVQLFKNKDFPVGAFAFENSIQLKSKLAEILKQLPGGYAGLEAKLIVCGKAAAASKRALEELKLPTLKVVEKPGPFELRFDPLKQKIFVETLAQVQEQKKQFGKNRKIRALIVDDSPTIQKILQKILSADQDIEVVATVGLPSQVEAAIEKYKPDVITLDIHLPEMNGVELLKKYLPKYKIPTVMISSISVEEGPLVLNALEAGAVDYIQKPSAQEISSVSPFIILKVKTAANASLHIPQAAAARKVNIKSAVIDKSKLVAIGSSTGGTEALKEVFLRLPKDIPPILVVQHIPAVFSKAFADRLNSMCPFEVCEGADGMEVLPGRAIIAPGGKHMLMERRGVSFVIRIEDTEPVNRHKPSVDVLMDSVARLNGANSIGVILTGMGSDGAKGLLAMKKAGAITFGQDEASCVVFGMPQAAMKLGATSKMVPLLEMAEVIALSLESKNKSAA